MVHDGIGGFCPAIYEGKMNNKIGCNKVGSFKYAGSKQLHGRLHKIFSTMGISSGIIYAVYTPNSKISKVYCYL